MATEEAFERAMELEAQGRRFYEEVAGRSSHPLVKGLFRTLAQEEVLHMDRIRQIYQQVQKGGFKGWIRTVGDPSKLKKVFDESLKAKASASKDDLEAVRFAMEREDEAMRYYRELAEGAEDPAEKRFWMLLSWEEQGHYLQLTDTLEYLTDPENWLMRVEGRTLDGA